MGMSIERKLRLQKQLEDWITNIFFNTRRFHWTSDFLNESLTKSIYENADFKRLPQVYQAELRGRISCERDRIWREEVVHSYECVDGKRRILGDYDMPSQKTRKSLITDTCQFVWKADNSKFWS